MEITVKNKARFSCLSSGLIRMEYSEVGEFEDRRSLRALTRPKTIKFKTVTEHNGLTCLSTSEMVVIYKPDGNPFNKNNIWIEDCSNNRIWEYGQIDNNNLGGVHLGMDCIQRNMLPKGVHSATSDYHENSTDFHLWGYVFGEGSVDSDSHYDGGMLTLEQLLATKNIEDMPQDLQRILKERQKYPPGILSRSGYFLYNDSNQAILDDDNGWIKNRENRDNMDLYFFYYKNDYKKALKDYRLLFGPSPLIPKYSLGLWYSRYPTFNEIELRDLIEEFKTHDLPLDVLVLDLEWHKRGWFGYDWDLEHINDPDGFLKYLKSEKIHTTFNVHPNGIPVKDSMFDDFIKNAQIEYQKKDTDDDTTVFKDFDFANKRHADSFMDTVLKPIQNRGIDFWWIDGDVPAKGVDVENQLWTNQVYQKHIEDNYKDKRPMIFSRTGGLGTHRYPFHFTGDTYSQWEVLENQVEYTLRAGFIGQSYITHDIGGHMSQFHFNDPELYCRWVQFGVLSPIFRLHSSGGSERRPWLYDERVLKSFKKALKFRMEMLPYLYTLSYESHKTCIPICRAPILENPEWEEAYGIWDSYYLGDRIFVTPVLTPGGIRRVLLPKGSWYNAINGELKNSDGKTDFNLIVSDIDVPPHYIKSGSLVVKQTYSCRAEDIPKTLVLEIYPGNKSCSSDFELYEDDGLSADYEAGKSSLTRFNYIEDENGFELIIDKSKDTFMSLPRHRDYEIRVFGNKNVIFRGNRVKELDGPIKIEGENFCNYKKFYLDGISIAESTKITASF